MVAVAIFVGFVSLLRGKGLLCIPSAGVTWLKGHRELHDPSEIPASHTDVLLLLTQRKTSLTQHSFVTLKTGKVTRILAEHVRWLNSLRPRPRFLFPARKRRWKSGRPSWVPSRDTAMSLASLLFLIRRALTIACGLSKLQASRFTVHSLRVGGINYYRLLGVPLEMRSQLADHIALSSSLRYLRMEPQQQINVLSSIVGRT